MRLISFLADKKPSFGVVGNENAAGKSVFDAGRRLKGQFSSLREILAANALDRLVQIAHEGSPDYRLDEIAMLPVIPDPEKILCVGINYMTHVKETGRDVPAHPMIFARFSSSQVGHNQPMIKPRNSDRFDFEGELAVVIGKSGRHVSKGTAFEHVAGYSCYNDGSARDWQRHTIQFTPGKNFPATGAFGPWLVTRDEIPDPSVLKLETRLNGEILQRAGCDDLIFSVSELVAYCSSFARLEPGDVIVTGTPGGVGDFRKPPKYMSHGDVVEVEISRIGTLKNTIGAE